MTEGLCLSILMENWCLTSLEFKCPTQIMVVWFTKGPKSPNKYSCKYQNRKILKLDLYWLSKLKDLLGSSQLYQSLSFSNLPAPFGMTLRIESFIYFSFFPHQFSKCCQWMQTAYWNMVPLIFNQFQLIINTRLKVKQVFYSFLLISIKTWLLYFTPDADSYLTTLKYFVKEKVKFIPQNFLSSLLHRIISLADWFTDIQGDKYSLCHNSRSTPSRQGNSWCLPHTSGNASCCLHVLMRNRIIVTLQKYGSQNSLNIYVYLDKAFAVALGLSSWACQASAVTVNSELERIRPSRNTEGQGESFEWLLN